MPRQYEVMRDKFKSDGLDDAAAKTKAAKIYNARRPEGAAPVTGKREVAYAKGGDIRVGHYAQGGLVRPGETRFTKKVSDKHLPDPSEAPNPFTDDNDDAPKGRGKSTGDKAQDYGKGK